MSEDPRYLPDPPDAIPVIAGLLRDRKWTELARCHDLTDSHLDVEDLARGRYFLDPDADTGHPVTRGWRHPFAPGFEYDLHQVDDDEALVHVVLQVDQGDGPVQTGRDSFEMRRHDEGWQILPLREDRE